MEIICVANKDLKLSINPYRKSYLCYIIYFVYRGVTIQLNININAQKNKFIFIARSNKEFIIRHSCDERPCSSRNHNCFQQ